MTIFSDVNFNEFEYGHFASGSPDAALDVRRLESMNADQTRSTRMTFATELELEATLIAPAGFRRDNLSTSQLLRRGWTRGLIARFLGKPDRYRTNPVYPHKAPMRLYRVHRVLAAESDSAFLRAQKRAAAQSAAARSRVGEAKLIAEHVDVSVERISTTKLRRRALSFRGPLSGREAILRSEMDYVLNHLTNYPKLHALLAGMPGAKEACAVLLRRVHEVIYGVYPHLGDAAQRLTARGAYQVGLVNQFSTEQ